MDKQRHYILAIDQGTTSSRAVIFDDRGDIVKLVQKELALFTPQNGYVEQDAGQIWQDVASLSQQVLNDFVHEIECIGITNQRETTIIWDRETGAPVHNAIVWQDKRTSDYCHDLKKKDKTLEQKVKAVTGLTLDPYFSATKIGWILDHAPCPKSGKTGDLRKRAEAGELAFGTVDSYLLWHLSGAKVHKTDATNACRTLLYDIRQGVWSKELCALLDIPMSLLPEVCANNALFAQVQNEALPSLKDVPVTAMIGDQHAATFGQACFSPGMMKSTYGTGCFALAQTGDTLQMSENGLLSTLAWQIDDDVTYALEGSIFVAGAAIQFLRDQFSFFASAKETYDLALAVDDTDGVVFIPSFSGLGAPFWDADVRGAILGMGRGTKKEHVVRAVLDAQAFQTKDLVNAFASDMKGDIHTIRVDGGLVQNSYVTQRIADICGLTIQKPKQIEATVWGAALMAGLGQGIYSDLNEIKALWQEKESFEPKLQQDVAGKEYQYWLRAVKAVQLFAVDS